MYLKNNGIKIWSTNTSGKGVTAMALQDSGNLVLLGKDNRLVWQSFSYPTDTLLSNQKFYVGMRLVSNTNPSNNLSYYLQVESGGLVLYAGFQTRQPYWSMSKDNRTTIHKIGGDRDVYYALLTSDSWRLYDRNQTLLLSQFIFASYNFMKATLAAVLGSDGVISFYNLHQGIKSNSDVRIKTLPQDTCSMPEACDPYNICYSDNKCECPRGLSSHMKNCKPETITSSCNSSSANASQVELVSSGEKFDYFALEFVLPSSKSDLKACKEACLKNCSCLVMFFENNLGNCFLFDQIGSLRQTSNSRFVSYFKVLVGNGDHVQSEGRSTGSWKQILIVMIIAVATFLIITGMLYLGLHYHRRNKRQITPPQECSSEDENFWENLAGVPIRFSYKELQTATDSFSLKLGHGGFGSVYKGLLQDGTKVAVKQLEGIGQGKKEFRAEVSIIGSIHHVHLVKLKGFCADEDHRLLVYEYMEKGSLDKWIFKNNESRFLEWGERFNIALGMAKGLAYLHEDCNDKIIHCDIKPENVLLDDNYQAKVCDFGLAKLMSREQSHVFTTLRGTRGYLAPEWITNYAISEKSDVYSFGMVFLEIIGGRKNFDITVGLEKSHFPSYAFKMLEQGRLRDVLDSTLEVDDNDENVLTAIKVALWCIQEDMYLRPSMNNVIQMLEGHLETPQPPTSSQMGSLHHASFYQMVGNEATSSSSGASQCYTNNISLTDVQLSGPR